MKIKLGANFSEKATCALIHKVLDIFNVENRKRLRLLDDASYQRFCVAFGENQDISRDRLFYVTVYAMLSHVSSLLGFPVYTNMNTHLYSTLTFFPTFIVSCAEL